MARILHLLPMYPDYQTEMAVSQLRGGDGDGLVFEVRTLGRGGNDSTAVAGIVALWRQAAPLDLIHAWGERALAVAAFGGANRIIYSPTEFPRGRAVRWLRSIMDYRQVQVICSTDTMRRAFVQKGVPLDRCHHIRPGVDFGRVNRRRDPATRAKLGFGDADRVLLAVGESTRAADHAQTAWAAVVLHVLDRQNRLLLWGRGPLAQQTGRFVQRLEQPDLCSIATDRLGSGVTFEQLLSAADVALVTASGPVSTLPIAVCMAAAMPIVAVANSTVSELLEDRHNAMLVSSATPRAVARRVLDVACDHDLQWKICDTARAEAYEFFSKTRFVRQFRAIYQQFAAGERPSVEHDA
jgi:glycosyltransferase involved in cell wall biosynthesis